MLFHPAGSGRSDGHKGPHQGQGPAFEQVAIQDRGKYLGYYIGPGKKDSSWSEALSKAEKKVHAWDWAPFGLFYWISAWNIYIVPILRFVAQLEGPPPNLHSRTAAMVRRAAHCSGSSCQPEDLLYLRRPYGMSKEDKDAMIMA